MKRLIVGSLSFLLLSVATAPVVRANEAAFNPDVVGRTRSSASKITPVNLVNLAYRGYLKNKGIPGYNGLSIAYWNNKVSAEDLVRSAVEAKTLPAQALSDKQYLNAVATQLDIFVRTEYDNDRF